MSEAELALKPFPGLPFPDDVRISATANRAGGTLELRWRLEAPDGTVEMPQPADVPERRRDLWEATCFEFFLASPERPGYWEFNLAPAGHWNVFRFDGYRAGMRDEPAFGQLLFSVATSPDRCEVLIRLDTAALGLASAAWRLGLTTVVAEPGGRISYWALAHPAPQPDFHLSEAFLVQL